MNRARDDLAGGEDAEQDTPRRPGSPAVDVRGREPGQRRVEDDRVHRQVRRERPRPPVAPRELADPDRGGRRLTGRARSRPLLDDPPHDEREGGRDRPDRERDRAMSRSPRRSARSRAPPRAAPLIIAAVHSPVATPTLCGSCSRTTCGTSPAASAMPMPARNAETGSTPGTVAASRMASATVSSSRARATVWRRPIRSAIRGTRRAKAPMHTTGMVVRAPIAALDQPGGGLDVGRHGRARWRGRCAG